VIGWPVFTQSFEWNKATIPEPALRKRSTPIGKVAALKFKSIPQAQLCRIVISASQGSSPAWLTLEPDLETREVRLLAPLDLAASAEALPDQAHLSFQVVLQLAGQADTKPLQQVAILARGADGELFPWRKLAHGVDPLSAGPHVWTFSCGGPDEPLPLETYLSLQMSPGCGPSPLVRSRSETSRSAPCRQGSGRVPRRRLRAGWSPRTGDGAPASWLRQRAGP